MSGTLAIREIATWMPTVWDGMLLKPTPHFMLIIDIHQKSVLGSQPAIRDMKENASNG